MLQGCKHAPVDDGRMPNPPPPETPDDRAPPASSASAGRVAPSASAKATPPAPSGGADTGYLAGVKMCAPTGERPCIEKVDDGTCRFLPAMAKRTPGGPFLNPPAIHAVPCPKP